MQRFSLFLPIFYGVIIMIENGFIYTAIVFSVISVLVGGVLWFAIRAMNSEEKRPGEH
jgi:hypothetical protein